MAEQNCYNDDVKGRTGLLPKMFKERKGALLSKGPLTPEKTTSVDYSSTVTRHMPRENLLTIVTRGRLTLVYLHVAVEARVAGLTKTVIGVFVLHARASVHARVGLTGDGLFLTLAAVESLKALALEPIPNILEGKA